MAGEKSKTPADVLARQRAERRVYAALDGLTPADAVAVLGHAAALYRQRHEDAMTERLRAGTVTPAGTEQQ